MPRPQDSYAVVHLQTDPPAHWAKHRARAKLDTRRLLRSWLIRGQWHYYFLLLSQTGSLLAREKYSAFAIDRIYANQQAGWGWLGRRLDRFLLDLPVHRAVRDRYGFVTRNLTAAIQTLRAAGAEKVTVLSVPCGLVRDLCTVYEGLRQEDAAIGHCLRIYGLDLDYEGRVLDEALRRAQAAAVPIRLVRANALADVPWAWLHAQEGSLSVVSCIGLSPWLSPQELAALFRRFAAYLGTGGYVFVDRFNRGQHNTLGEGAEIRAHYHTDQEYRDHARASGLMIEKWETLGTGEAMCYVLRKSR